MAGNAPVPSVRTSSKSRTDSAFELQPSSLLRGSCWIFSGGSTFWSLLNFATNCFSCRTVSGVTMDEAGDEEVGEVWCDGPCWWGCNNPAAIFLMSLPPNIELRSMRRVSSGGATALGMGDGYVGEELWWRGCQTLAVGGGKSCARGGSAGLSGRLD